MELTQQITDMFRTKRETKWQTQIQQDTELVKPYVSIHPNCQGKAVEMPAYGKTDMQEYDGRFQKVEWQDMPFGKRTMRKRKFYNAIPLEEDDKMDMDTLDFTASNVMSEQRKALARMNDEVILGVMKDKSTGLYRVRTQADGVCGGILAPNYTGNDGATIEELDTDPTSFNVIPVDYAAKGTKTDAGMLLDKIALLRARYQMLDMFKAGRGEEIVVAITPYAAVGTDAEPQLRVPELDERGGERFPWREVPGDEYAAAGWRREPHVRCLVEVPRGVRRLEGCPVPH